jgi:asparagine synthase (glutamine-hydrolysing)
MCGIVSIFNPTAPIDKEKLLLATHSLAHRGPDGEKVWISLKGNAGLGHRRLSIIDPQGGIQPIANGDGSIVAVVNGELYGYKEIRSALQSKGYVFRTHSDSEIVLHLYAEYGIDFLTHLRGEFAFIIYDQKTNAVIAGRDRFGIKPLQYHLDSKGTLFIASEAKAIFAAGIKPAWDTYALYHSYCLQYLPQDRTLFENVLQLKPGHVLRCDATGLSIKKYWDLDFPLENDLDTKEYDEDKIADTLEALLIESVSLRLQTDGAKYCCHLSGGIDSAMVAALAAKLGSQRLHCFTVSFSHHSYDETELARNHAAYIGADFSPIVVDSAEVIDLLSDAVYFSEGTAINSHLAAKYILNKKIREAGYKIALTGEGSDEALAGYIHLKADLLGEIIEGSNKRDNIVSGVQLPSGQFLNLDSIKEKLGYVPTFLKAKGSIGYTLNSLLNPDFKNQYSTQQMVGDFIDSLDIKNQLLGRSKVNQSSYIWTKFTLANYILKTLGDGTEMPSSIEGRVPFLDHHFFDFAKTIPISLKIKGETQKYILRKIARKYITPEICEKPKQSFMAPPLSLLQDKSGLSFVHDCFASREFSDMGLFEQKKVLTLIDTVVALEVNAQIALEPSIMLILTSYLAYSRFKI